MALERDERNFEPVFGPEGKYLYFCPTPRPTRCSARPSSTRPRSRCPASTSPSCRRRSVPFAPRSDEGTPAKRRDEKARGEEGGPRRTGARAKPSRRPGGPMSGPCRARSGRLHRRSHRRRGGSLLDDRPRNRLSAPPLPGEAPQLHRFDMDRAQGGGPLSSLDGYDLSADGQFVVYKQKKDYYIAPAKAAAAPAGAEAAKTSTVSTMKARHRPGQGVERGCSTMAWRLERDFFFNPKMNGVDWNAVPTSYRSCCRSSPGARTSTT